jgi:hypothetical protein
MITTHLKRTLTLCNADSPHLSATSQHLSAASQYLSAASGMVFVGDYLYVVADDENHLGVFPKSGTQDGTLHRIFTGELPQEPAARKAAKRDMEALVQLPRSATYPHGALLALGSGSKPQRCTGVVLALDALGAIAGVPIQLNLSLFYAQLALEVGHVNIESAVVIGDELRLLNRGNKKHSINACVSVKLSNLLLSSASRFPKIGRLEPVELGKINGVQLCFSDAAALPNGGMLFTAAAENTDDSYLDGACAGNAVGILDKHMRLRFIEELDTKQKIEGVSANLTATKIQLQMVSDADDPAQPAQWLTAEFPLPWA